MNKILIECIGLSKKYQNNIVLKNFNYSFLECGLYILYGASGSGKTTLLNLLTGLLEFQDGKIIFDNNEYQNKVDFEYIADNITYIMQENYFVDYLTVIDNLKMCCETASISEIENVLKKVYLDHKMMAFPGQLSGGEKQRLSIAKFILEKKKVLFLDEPTASLDFENRNLFFKIVDSLKSDVLIICSTHDDSIFKYASEIIDFNNLEKYNQKLNNNKRITKIFLNKKKKNKNTIHLLKYMFKQFKYPKKEKKSTYFLIIVFIISLLLEFSCSNFKEKLIQSLIDRYNVNSVKVYCSIENNDYCSNILNQYNSKYFTYQYSENIPNELPEDAKDGGVYQNSFDAAILTLPFDSKYFKLTNSIRYGRYFSNVNEVILGYQAAMAINENLNELVGTEIELSLPDGKKKFVIAGIFNELLPSEKIYLKSSFDSLNFDSYIYINSEYTKRYLYDDVLGYNETGTFKSTVLISYFENSKDLYRFYKDTVNNNPIVDGISSNDFTTGFVEYELQANKYQKILIPIILISITTSLLFYFQVRKIELFYTNYIISVYQQYGYKYKTIEKATIIFNLITVIFKLFISIVFSMILTKIINYIVDKFSLLNFKLLLVDYNAILLLLTCVSITSIILSKFILYQTKRKGLLNYIKERSDLL